MRKGIIPAFLAICFMVIGAGGVFGQTASVAGEWDGVFNTPGGERPFKFVLAVDGEKLTGTAKRTTGDVPITGTIKGDEISFSYTISYNGNDVTMFFTGKVSGDSISGAVSFNGEAEDAWSAKRAAAE